MTVAESFALTTESDAAALAYLNEVLARQSFTQSMGVSILWAKRGECALVLPARPDLCQQDGFFHGGAVSAFVDVSGGYAAWSVAEPGHNVLTVEYKTNFLKPAVGSRLIGHGKVKRAGRSLTVTEVDIYGERDGALSLCACALQTLMNLPPQ
ncbi:PaaI family thioesterase [Elstera sp.]|jgi:uncharacterized protein (TIGR00369 family)|uniref:PaaI family thioesterase n=1 Tax=Elstera sp. TaxID=1916664 RepID=UPI0037C113BD